MDIGMYVLDQQKLKERMKESPEGLLKPDGTYCSWRELLEREMRFYQGLINDLGHVLKQYEGQKLKTENCSCHCHYIFDSCGEWCCKGKN